ncbi:MAG: hypothetical protein HY399_04865 [Elusimicrobia bacterium]|nr:hypothetical protein [Elusimicrobiota bacterium]
MTPRQSQRISVPRAKSRSYAEVADNFFKGAEVAKGFEYWNAAGVLIVHSAIAFTDAITIKVGGVKSRGEDHMAAVDLLGEVIVLDEKGQGALRHLTTILEQKTLVSYSGEIYTHKEVERLWKHLERYKSWAHSLLS